MALTNYVGLQKRAKQTSGVEWREVTLGDITEFLSGGTPSKSRGEYWNGSVPWVSAKEMKRLRLYGTEEQVTAAGVENGTRMVPKNTVLILVRGMTLLNDVPVSITQRPMTFNQDIKALRPKSEIAEEFLPYIILGNKARLLGLVDLASHGTGRLNTEELKAIRVRLPPLPEQRAIAHILGTLDDKIELNRRMNETLEQMARALFKSWFVDFDPVRAKMEGRWQAGQSLSGLPAHLYDLFPSRLVPSELGEVPEGWQLDALGTIANQRRVGVHPEHIDPSTPYIALEHMPKRCVALSAWGTSAGLASGKFRFKQGDILFGKLRPYFHKVGVAPLDGVCSTDIVVISPSSPCWFGLVLGYASSSEFVDYTDAASTGTKMPRTKWADMARYKIALPSRELSCSFNSIVLPCIDRMHLAIHESRFLVAQREALLPKLLSGKVTTKETEWVVANVHERNKIEGN